MVTIIYNPNSYSPATITCSDGEVNHYADLIEIITSSDSPEAIITTSTFTLIQELRARIVEKRINWQNIQFQYNNQIVEHFENGKMANWPEGFGDIMDKTLDRLLG